MSDSRPILALTTGEPAGIGPDLAVTLVQESCQACLVAVTDPQLLQTRARALNLPLVVESFRGTGHRPGTIQVVPVPLAADVVVGQPDIANAGHVLSSLDRAIDGCLAGEFHAVITAPVHKSVINDASIPFTGHTEYLARRTGSSQPVMLLVTPTMRVALATTHLPLRDVATHITKPLLRAVLHVLDADLRRLFGIASPRIVVCGLNPHAGESGHFGTEEIDVLIPVIEELNVEGMRITGPVPADSAFVPSALQGVDAVLAMFHDQGLPPIKHSGFANAVNVTLGLPLIRTSVDHGTALELAGTGRADVGSLRAAVALAAQLVEVRQQHSHQSAATSR